MSYIKNQDYSTERVRPKLLANYLDTMQCYLQTQFPDRSPDQINGFLKGVIKDRFKAPKVEAVFHKREGYSEIIEQPLHTFTQKIIGSNNLSPSGSCYLPASKRESFLRSSIESKVAERNDFKKKYLAFEAQGRKREAQYYYQNQANAKIFNNAIAGGMKIKQFILGSKAGFNAITSTGRMSVKQGYSFIERLINGNIYIPSTRDAITYIMNHVRHVPADFHQLVEQKTLYIPTVDDVIAYLAKSMRHYVINPDLEELRGILTNVSEIERTYVFYAGCFSNLCRFNEDLMRPWIDSCFISGSINPDLYANIEPDELKKINGDVVVCILATNYQRLGRNPQKPDKWNTLKDAAKYNPQGLKEFIYCCKHFVEHFVPMLKIIRPIVRIETTFSKLTFQHRMARETVPLSDTDSNIFSTQELVRWKCGEINFSPRAYEMNALMTFIISQSLEHVFARLSAGFGAEGKDVFRIAMKNEFLYPVLVATSLAKHYIAIATMQEGNLLPTPRKDIKGIGLRSSTYPKLVRDSFADYMSEFVGHVEKGEPIRAASVLEHVANLERTIYDSVKNRDSIYLQTVSVKRKEDYSEPMKSQYFYYEMWQAVFAEDFGEMVIPNKCFKIPLIGGKKMFKSAEFLTNLETHYPNIHRKLIVFLRDNPDRDVSAILVPPMKGKIHPFFLEVMDIRAHISQIMMGYYHFLEALGIGTINTSACALVSDAYKPDSDPM